jgi:hypothetical protein
MGGFSQGERERLEAAGFTVTAGTATAGGATVTITAAGYDGVSTTMIELPGGGCLRLEMHHVARADH